MLVQLSLFCPLPFPFTPHNVLANPKQQTIMSTDILQYSKIPNTNNYEEDYSSAALKRYVSVTLPLMALTFLAWWILYWWVDRKQRVKALKDQIKKMNKGGLVNFVWLELLRCSRLHRFGEARLLLEMDHDVCKGIKGRCRTTRNTEQITSPQRNVMCCLYLWYGSWLFLSTKVGRGFEDLSRLPSYIRVSPLSCDWCTQYYSDRRIKKSGYWFHWRLVEELILKLRGCRVLWY